MRDALTLRRRIAQRLAVRRGAEAGEVFLAQRRVFILPTRAGLLFGLTLIVLLLASINYDLGLGYALTFLLGACAIVDMLLTHRNLAHLHLRPGRAAPVFAGEEARFELHLSNQSRHARFAIVLGFADAVPGLDHAVDVEAGGTAAVTLGAPTHRRGWMPAPRITLHTRFPLGLMRAWSYWQPELRVLVYPRPEERLPPLPLQASGRQSGRGTAGHDDFAGIRAYQVGDAPRQLAWRQIARSENGVLVTKQFQGGDTAELVLDLAQLPAGMDLEAKLSRMTGWVLAAEAGGLPYALRLGGRHLPAANGTAHQAACLRALAVYGDAP